MLYYLCIIIHFFEYNFNLVSYAFGGKNIFDRPLDLFILAAFHQLVAFFVRRRKRDAHPLFRFEDRRVLEFQIGIFSLGELLESVFYPHFLQFIHGGEQFFHQILVLDRLDYFSVFEQRRSPFAACYTDVAMRGFADSVHNAAHDGYL